jgi:hypothetical protein
LVISRRAGNRIDDDIFGSLIDQGEAMAIVDEHVKLGLDGGGGRYYPPIDYRGHPAFRSLDVPKHPNEEFVDAQIEEIDAGLRDLARAPGYPDAELVELFKKGPARKIEVLRTHLAQTTTNPRLVEWLSVSFDEVLVDLLEEARVANLRGTARTPLCGTPGARVFADLKRDGAHFCRLDDWTLEALRRICAPDMEILRARARVGHEARYVQNYERYGKTGKLLSEFFKKAGVLEGLAAYVGSNVNFAGFALEYSYAGQNWWKGCYADLGLPDSKTTYMHYDHGCRDPKAIIALTEVSEANGPTSFVLGSHAKKRSRFLHSMIKSMDQNFAVIVRQEGHNYYRSRFSDMSFRRDFLALPTALQGCSHFGEDIVDGSPISKELLEKEVRMTSDRGNCVVFDGNYGIHRGANVQEGERFAFQVVFLIDPKLSLRETLRRRLRGLALNLLRGTR